MSEFEYIETTMILTEFMRNAAMDFVTVFFAYCVCAYLVGKSLPKIVAVGVTIVYIAFLLNPVFGIIGITENLIQLSERESEAFPDNFLFADGSPGIAFRAVTLFVPILAWASSILYMHAWVRSSRSDA